MRISVMRCRNAERQQARTGPLRWGVHMYTVCTYEECRVRVGRAWPKGVFQCRPANRYCTYLRDDSSHTRTCRNTVVTILARYSTYLHYLLAFAPQTPMGCGCACVCVWWVGGRPDPGMCKYRLTTGGESVLNHRVITGKPPIDSAVARAGAFGRVPIMSFQALAPSHLILKSSKDIIIVRQTTSYHVPGTAPP
jgi:hypothetical protein